jgi:hypothetical protein
MNEIQFLPIECWRGFDNSVRDVEWIVFKSTMVDDLAWGWLVDTGEQATDAITAIMYKQRILAEFSGDTPEEVMQQMQDYCKGWEEFKPDNSTMTAEEKAFIDKSRDNFKAKLDT